MNRNIGPGRQPSSPGNGAVRGSIAGLLGSFVALWVAGTVGQSNPELAQAAGAAAGGAVVSVTTAAGKVARDTGGPLGQFIGMIF